MQPVADFDIPTPPTFYKRFTPMNNAIVFSAGSGKAALKITADRIEVGEGVEVTEAAQAVLDALRQLVVLPCAERGPYTVWGERSTNWNGVRPVGQIVARVEDPTALFRVVSVDSDGLRGDLLDLSEPYFLPVSMDLSGFMPVHESKVPSWVGRLADRIRAAMNFKPSTVAVA